MKFVLITLFTAMSYVGSSYLMDLPKILSEMYSNLLWPPVGIVAGLFFLFRRKSILGIFSGYFLQVILTREAFFDSQRDLYLFGLLNSLITLLPFFILDFFNKEKQFNISYYEKNLFKLNLFIFPLIAFFFAMKGTFLIYFFNQHSFDILFNIFYKWMIGDATGLIVFVPIIIYFQSFRERKSKLVISTSFATIIFFTFIFYTLLDKNKESISIRFDAEVNSAQKQITEKLNSLIFLNNNLKTFFQLNLHVTYKEFLFLSNELRNQYPFISNFSWSEVVENTTKEKNIFVNGKRDMGHKNFNLKNELSINEQIVPVSFIWPRENSNTFLGSDLLLDKNISKTLIKARQLMVPSATPPIFLHDIKKTIGITIFTPVQSSDKIKGFVSSSIKLDTIFKDILNLGEIHSVNSNEKLIFSAPTKKESKILLTKTLKFADQKWIIKYSLPKQDYISLQDSNLFMIQVILHIVLILVQIIIINVVTVQRQVEEENDRTSGFINKILNSTKFSVITTDVNGIIKTFNKSAQEMLGYKPEEIINLKTPSIIHLPSEVMELNKRLNEKYDVTVPMGFETFIYEAQRFQKPYDYEFTYVHKEGHQIPVRLSLTILQNKNKETIGYLGIAEDISEILQARSEQKDALSKMEKAMNTKSEFLANMSHEIRTPMNGVLGLTDALLSTKMNEDQTNMLKTLQGSGNLLMNILNDILELSKIESENFKLATTPFSPEKAFLEIVNLYKQVANNKGIELKTNIKVQTGLKLLGDEFRLKQIFGNLINNALKFTDKGKVDVTLNYLNDELVFKVKDTGIGMEENHKLFEQFSQADPSITRRYGGTGLGLSIVKTLTQFMEGRVAVESVINQGSTFTVYLPLEMSNESEVADENGETISDSLINNLNTNPPLILLAEDNKVNQLVVQKILGQYNIEPIIAENGKIAIDMLIDYEPDIILMDIQMPIMDGLKATEFIREKMKLDVYIIALTANAFESDKEQCFDAGMNGFISKPFSKKQFLLAFNNYYKNLNS